MQPTTMCPGFGPRCTVPTTVPCPPCVTTRSPTVLSVTRAGTAIQPNTIVHHRLACNRPVRRNLTRRRASQIWVGGPSTTTQPFAKRWRAEEQAHLHYTRLVVVSPQRRLVDQAWPTARAPSSTPSRAIPRAPPSTS
jgi:hypothetical protein